MHPSGEVGRFQMHNLSSPPGDFGRYAARGRMPYARLQPVFTNATEIRMGSPYSCVDLTLNGSWVPKLPDCDWQDVSAESDDGRLLALVAWDHDNNQPGFRILVIDKKDKTIRRSERLAGCCKSVAITASIVTFETFNVITVPELLAWDPNKV